MVMNKTLRAVIQLLDNGLVSIPLSGKRPLLKNWSTFFNKNNNNRDLTKDDVIHGIVDYSDKRITYENKNIGILTGEISNCIVVDIDDMNGLKRLTERGPIPKTWTVKTSRGLHLYFNYDPRVCSTKLWGQIDILSDKRQVVAPPSIHPSGTVYTWMISPKMVPKADPPKWLLELLFKQQSKEKNTCKLSPKKQLNKRQQHNNQLESVDWFDFYSKHTSQITGNGEWLSSLCPFHDDQHNSFSFNQYNGGWICFAGCGSGNGYQAIQKLYGVTPKQAFRLMKGENIYVK